jgi:hypothetical protein
MSQKKPKRRLGEGIMRLISLVPRGANQARAIFKDRNVVELQGVAKMDSEGLLTSVVFLVEQTDSQGDIASKDIVKSYCHNFIPNMEGNGIDVMHDGKPVGNERAHLCENFIVQKGDPRFQDVCDADTNEKLDATDAWATVTKIHDPVLKAPYESGEWCGVSMFGSAMVEPLTKFDNQTDPQEDQEMNEDKFAEMLKTFGVDLSTSLVEGISKAVKPKEPKVPAKTVVKFEGDTNDPKALAKHKDNLFLANCDLTTLEGLTKWEDYVAKRGAKEEPEDTTELQKQIDALQARIDKADKASTDPADVPVGKAGESIKDKLARGTARVERLKKSGDIR